MLKPEFKEVLVRGIPLPRYDALKLGVPRTALLERRWSAKRPDVVHLVTEGPLGWSALRAALALKLPIASDFHQLPQLYEALRSRLAETPGHGVPEAFSQPHAAYDRSHQRSAR